MDNQNKKTHFIAGFSNHLSQNGFQCLADADTTIAKITIEYQSSRRHVAVNADDTVLCILIHHWKKTANTSRPRKVTQGTATIFIKELPRKIMTIKSIF